MRRGEEDEESSQCSSGCQSGWTVYLEQSGSAGQHQRCTVPYQQRRQTMLPQAEYSSDDEEDSMVSDASSGPQVEGQMIQCMLSQPQLRRRRSFLEGDECCYDDSSSGTGGRRSESFSGSGNSFVSTRRSPGLGDVKSGKKRKAAVVKREEAAAMGRNAGVVDDDDNEDLHDSASSSAVACTDVVEAMHGGRDELYMDLQPSCVLSRPSILLPSGRRAVRSTGVQGFVMLHRN